MKANMAGRRLLTPSIETSPSIEKQGDAMIPVQIRINRKMVEKIDQLVEAGVYSNRSEVIRDATRRLVIEFSGKRDLATEVRKNG